MTNNWQPFYKSIAHKLFGFYSNQPQLFKIIKNLAARSPLLNYLHFEREEFWAARQNRIDPFTVMGIFNRGVSDEHRHEMGQLLANALSVFEDCPTVFHGIAFLDPRKSIYDGNDQIWRLTKAAMQGDAETAFQTAYDAAKEIKGNALGDLSIALFWFNPDAYMALDSTSIPFIKAKFDLEAPASKCTGLEYCQFIQKLKHQLNTVSFSQLALEAWKYKHA